MVIRRPLGHVPPRSAGSATGGHARRSEAYAVEPCPAVAAVPYDREPESTVRLRVAWRRYGRKRTVPPAKASPGADMTAKRGAGWRAGGGAWPGLARAPAT